MVKKVQVPVLGGIRKVINVSSAQQTGTTIAGFESQTLTLTQLRALLGVPTIPTSGSGSSSSSAPSASLALGPGLSGGGPVLGAVPIHLTAPIPAFIFGDDGGGGDSEPGPPGAAGAAGAAGPTGGIGPAGPAIFMAAEDGVDGTDAIPGPAGAQGPTGPAGGAGAAGISVYLPNDADETETPFVPGLPTKVTSIKGASWVSPSGALVAGSTNVVYLTCPVAGTIKNAKLLTAGGPGSCVVDVWKTPFGSFPPNSGNSICGASKPTISGGVSYSDSALTGWTTTINAGDVLAFSLASSSTFTAVSLFLEVER